MKRLAGYKHSTLFAGLVSIFAASGLPPAHADLSANPIILEFQDGRDSRKDINVSNSGDRTAYITVEAVRIANPGEAKEEYISSPDPAEIGLLVAPRSIVLKPNEQKVIRVVMLDKDISEDKAWRVNIMPVAGDIESDSNVVVTQLGYRALVYARPEDAFGEIQGQREGNSLTVKNTGNTNIMLEGLEQCDAASGDCRKLPLKRLWPGQSKDIELPFAAPANFKIRGPKGVNETTF